MRGSKCKELRSFARFLADNKLTDKSYEEWYKLLKRNSKGLTQLKLRMGVLYALSH